MNFRPQQTATAIIISVLLALAGCAHDPSSGGPTVPTAHNRLVVTMTTQQPINDAYIYDFAFDDDNISSTGPAAIVGFTNLTNGVVGGSFTVLVQYRGGQYTVYRRTATSATTETLDRASRAFVVAPTPAGGGNTLSFTLDLDALTDSGARLFKANTQYLDTNFVTTNTILRDPNDFTRKAYDAFGPQLPNFYNTFDIRANRTYTNAQTVQEPANDVLSDDPTGSINLAQLDIVDFTLTIQRQQ
ncbi:MAG: hypothetical protein JO316_07640 [Abitibacteriaceae bacterium]|nr:hypothetical protein [Abditibacteriaceae bacterium]